MRTISKHNPASLPNRRTEERRRTKTFFAQQFADNPVNQLTGRENFQLMRLKLKSVAALHAAARIIIRERDNA